MTFDPWFDARADASGGDPDSTSAALRAYHRLLWSKPLPDGRNLLIPTAETGAHLECRSDSGDIPLSSDSAIPTYTCWKRMEHVISQIPSDQQQHFVRVSYQMGGMMIFPSRRVGTMPTINQEKGTNSSIADRLDLTLECIQRHYLGQASPLAETLRRYADFFALFEDFDAYVDFFLLQDLIEGTSVKLFLDIDDTWSNALPRDLPRYEAYRAATLDFVERRNRRMAAAVGTRPADQL